MVHSYGGYTTNLPLEDLLDGKAWIAYRFDGEELAPEHGGPARLLVPHLYFWKSAKWVRGIELLNQDEPGFWETPATTIRRPMARAAVSGRLIWRAATAGRGRERDADGARRWCCDVPGLAGPPARASTSTCGSPPRTATPHSAAIRSLAPPTATGSS